MVDTIQRRVWRFTDGSIIEFDTRTKAIKSEGGKLALGALLCIRDIMPDMMRRARGQSELDALISDALDKLII
jgi:hypothetical protein